MKVHSFAMLVAALALCACSNSAGYHVQCVQWSTVNVPALTPAPKGETPLERWRRTKADYDRLDKWRDEQYGLFREEEPDLSTITWPALEAYEAAEKELQTINCGKLCVPGGQ